MDSDWAADHRDSGKSRTGYVFYFGNCILTWCSTMQPTPSQSTAEEELMAATIATNQCVYLRDVVEFLGYKQSEATVIFEDNNACIHLSKNHQFHRKTKHINIRWFYVREKCHSNEIVLYRIDSKNNVADLFTKNISGQQFRYLLNLLYEY